MQAITIKLEVRKIESIIVETFSTKIGDVKAENNPRSQLVQNVNLNEQSREGNRGAGSCVSYKKEVNIKGIDLLGAFEREQISIEEKGKIKLKKLER